MTEKLNQLAADVTKVLKNEVVQSPRLGYEYEAKMFDAALQEAYKAHTADPANKSLNQAIQDAEAYQQKRFDNPIDSAKANNSTLQVESKKMQQLRGSLTDASKGVSAKNEPVVEKAITPQEFVTTLKKAVEISKKFESTPAIRDAVTMAGTLITMISKEGRVTPELMQKMRQVQDELQAATVIDTQSATKVLKDNITYEMHLERKLPELMDLLVSNYAMYEDSKNYVQEMLFGMAIRKSDINSKGDFVSNLAEMITLLKDPSTDDKQAKIAKFQSLLSKLELSDKLNEILYIPYKWS